ncbi:MAG: hypothetical protein LBU51_09955 [Bacteroidales bacterium]|jgi:hypothetical protein|nr:hypothetical protein [Bacteroidales bacterium]
MKKVFGFVIFLIYLIASLIYIKIYEADNLQKLAGRQGRYSTLTIEELNINSGRTDLKLIEKIEELARQNGLIVTKTSFFPRTLGKKRRIVVFNSGLAKSVAGFDLVSGRFLKAEDDLEKFISSEESNNPNQIGRISFFNLDSTLEIRPFAAMKQYGIDAEHCKFDTVDDKILDKIKDELLKNFGGKINFQKENKNDIDDLEYHNFWLAQVSRLLVILYCLALMITTYLIIFRYKEFAVLKMFGVTSSEIRLKVMFKELLLVHFICFSVCFGGLFTSLANITGIKNTFLFFKSWRVFSVILTIVSLILSMIPSLILKYITIPHMLKNKKPLMLVQLLNYFAKLLFAILLISSMAFSFSSFNDLRNKKANMAHWGKTANYSTILIGTGFYGTEKEGWKKDFAEKVKKFFHITNEKGGIFISPALYSQKNSITEQEEHFKEIGKKDLIKPYGSYRSITVNNNYLKINPIYDESGQQVDIPDHSTHTLTILVPKNLKNFHAEIVKEYSHPWFSQNSEDFKLNVLYVEPNQKYFTFNPYAAKESNNLILDPIVEVISNENIDSDRLSCGLTGDYYVKVENIDNPAASIKNALSESGCEKFASHFSSVYSLVSEEIFLINQELRNSIVMLSISVIATLTLIFTTAINYLEKQKLGNTVLKIHGIPFITRYIEFYLANLCIWLASCFVIFVSYFILAELSSSHVFIKLARLFVAPPNKMLLEFLTVCVFVDILISTVVLRVNESKKIGNVLKGEE